MLAIKRSPFDFTEIRETRALPSSSAFWRFVEENLPPESIKLVATRGRELIFERDFASLSLDTEVLIILCPCTEDDDVFGALASLAMIAVAVFLVQPWLATTVAPLFGLAGAAATGFAALGTGLFMAAGGMLVSGLMAHPSADVPALSFGTGDMSSSPTYSWSPVTTQAQGGVIPVAFGVVPLHGNIIMAFREYQGDKEIINVLIDLGIWRAGSLYDFRINNQELNQTTFPGVMIDTRLGHIDQTCITWFNDSKSDHPVGTTVRYDGGALTVTTDGSNFTGLDIVIRLPNGLGYVDDNSNLTTHNVQIKVEIKPAGGDWHTITSSMGTTAYWETTGYWSAGHFTTDEWAGSYWIEATRGSTDPAAHYQGEISDWGDYGPCYWQWFDTSHQEVVATVLDYVTYSAAKRGALTYTVSVRHLTPGTTYDMRVTKLSTDQDGLRYIDTVEFYAYEEVTEGDGLQYPRHTLVGIRGLASDRLSGSFSFECKGRPLIAQTTDGDVWTCAFSDNQAWVAWNILTRPLFGDDLDEILRYDGLNPSSDAVDVASFMAFANFCDSFVSDGHGGTEKRFTFNGLFDFKGTVWSALGRVLEPARTVPLHTGKKLTLWTDQADTPRALYTVGSIEMDSWSSGWLGTDDRASSLTTSFLNSEMDYAMKPAGQIEPDINGDQETSVDSFGLTKMSEVRRNLRYKLAKNKYLTATAKMRIFLSYLRSRFGDVINVQHDVPQIGKGGRLVAATLTTLTLDKTVTIGVGTYAVIVAYTYPSIVSHGGLNYRCMLGHTAEASSEPGVGSYSDIYWQAGGDDPDEAWTLGHTYVNSGQMVQRAVSDGVGDHTVVTLAALPKIPSRFDEWAFGLVTTLVKPYQIANIKPSQDLVADIDLIEYNSSIYPYADSGTPALPTINYNSPNVLPPVTNIKAQQANGVTGSPVTILWTRPASSYYHHAVIYYKPSGGAWVYAGESFGSSFTLPVSLVDGTYDFAVATVGIGLAMEARSAPRYSDGGSSFTVTSATAILGSSTLADGAVTNTKVADNAVSTTRVADHAITSPVSAYTSGAIDLVEDVYTTIQSASITSTGAPVFISCSFAASKVGTMMYRIYCGSTLVYQSPSVKVGINDIVQIASNYTDQPASGTYTYYLKAYYQGPHIDPHPQCEARSLYLLETKK